MASLVASKRKGRSRAVAIPLPASANSGTVKSRAAGAAVADLLLQRMAGVVLASGIGVVRGRADAGPRWANPAFLTMSGYDREALGRLDWAALAPIADFPPPVAGEAVAPTVEREFVREDGSRWPVMVSRGTDPTDGSQLILFVVDLTASRIAEAARRAADQRYARFFEISNVAFWTADAQGRATLTSTTTADRLRSDVELAEFTDQAQLLHPDDRVFAVATWEGAVASGEAYDMEVRARGLDGGEYRWTRLRAFPDIVDGVVVSWYGTTEDVHERRLVANALAESEQRFKRLADDIPVMVWLTDENGDATYLSKTWYDFTGQTETEALGRGWRDAVIGEDRDRMSPITRAMARGQSFDLDFRLRAADGTARWMVSSGRPRFDVSGKLVGYAGSLTDIHARKMAERDLAETQLRLSRALDGTGVGVWEWDAATDTVTVSGSALGISGIDSPSEEYLKVDYRRAVHPDDRARIVGLMSDYIEGRIDEFTCEVRIRRNGGGWVWVLDRGLASARDSAGRATRMVGTLTNIDESKRAEELLRWTIDHDALTGLASRTLFHSRLDAALAAGGSVALALLDIDDFKAVNDVLGHAAGDALLTVLARRLAEFGGPGETVARLGGDEFTLVMPECGDQAQLIDRLERLRARLAEPFVYDGRSLTCRSSIGVAVAPAHGRDASTLLRSADVAMYSAKAGRRGGVAVFEPALDGRRNQQASVLATVRAALEENRLVCAYEPVVRLVDNRVTGVEMIVRVAGGAACLLDIHNFDGTFADTELTCRLGHWITGQAIADFARWRKAGRAPEFVAVDVSLTELRQGDYAARLLALLAAHDIPPTAFRIGIVEAGLNGSRNSASGEATLAALASGGLLAGLDCFGVGSASLSQLARLPLAAVKIDPLLIRNVATGEKDRLIVGAVAGLGRSFGLRVVAVGVETEAQATAVAELGCTYGQGRWFGEPVGAAAVAALLS